MSFFTKDQIQKLLDNSPFIAFLKMEVKDVHEAKQQITIRTPMRPEFERAPTGHWHAGPLAAVIYPSAYAAPSSSGHAADRQLSLDYVRPAIDTALVAVASVRRLAKASVSSPSMSSFRGVLVVIGRATCSTLAPT